jgi:hypothetical protein
MQSETPLAAFDIQCRARRYRVADHLPASFFGPPAQGIRVPGAVPYVFKLPAGQALATQMTHRSNVEARVAPGVRGRPDIVKA